MADQAHIETDRILAEKEEELAAFYAELAEKLGAKQAMLFRDYYRQLDGMKSRLDEGSIDEDEFKDWLRKQASKPSVTKGVQELASEVVRADQKAATIINGSLAAIFILNLSWAAEKLQKQFEADVSTKIVRYDTPEAIAKLFREAAEQRKQFKAYKESVINTAKDYKFYEQQVKAVVDYGVRTGATEHELGEMLHKIAGTAEDAARRHVRTYYTSTENLSRLDYALELADQGYKIEKKWIATSDRRTRDSHRDIDGTTQDVHDEFGNGLQFPGDFDSGKPEEYWNCRCCLNLYIIEYPDGTPGAYAD